MNYAVIKSGGKQYRVTEGDLVEVDRLHIEKGKVSFEDVFLLVTDQAIKIGKPNIVGEKVEATLVEHFKGDKIRVSKFKSKVRYRKTIGFRASKSLVKIEKIGKLASKSTAKATSKKE